MAENTSTQPGFGAAAGGFCARLAAGLLGALVLWSGGVGAVEVARELANLRWEGLRFALTADEDERIVESLRFYERLPQGEAFDMVALYRAFLAHVPEWARVFVVAGTHPRLPRALVNLASFFYPRRIFIAPASPPRELWRPHPDLFVLTLAGPHLRDPEGVLEPLVETEEWILWGAP